MFLNQDNFAHDIVKYNFNSLVLEPINTFRTEHLNKEPFQCHAYKIEEETKDFKRYSEVYFPLQDLLMKDYMRVRAAVGKNPNYAESNFVNKTFQTLATMFNKKAFLGAKEWLPTVTFRWLRHVQRTWPQHRLILADFDELPESLDGHQGPVVQSRYKGDTYQCSNWLLSEGQFDIFFPTDFETLALIYQFLKVFDHHECESKILWPTTEQLKHFTDKIPSNTTLTSSSFSSSSSSSKTNTISKDIQTFPRCMKQSQFMKIWADLDQCKTRSGQIPMLDFYENVSMLLT